LHGSPAKLKNDNECGIIDHLGILGRILAIDAEMKDEWEADVEGVSSEIK